ncbi:MAG: DUF7507 domain-containing protein [Rhizobiaceae bacterium]
MISRIRFWKAVFFLFFFAAVCFSASPVRAQDTFPGTTITGNSGSITGSNTGASGESGEPTTFGGGQLETIWYSWTAPSSGLFVVETCSTTQTNFDTTLKTYTGNAVNALTTIAQNDDACAMTSNPTLASRNSFIATSGTTYRIQVDGYRNNDGNFLLTWNFTPGATVTGDDFPGITISGASGSVTGSNVGATGETGEPTTFGGGSLNTIWYSWTAPATGTVTFDTCSNTQTTFDTTIASFTGGAVNALTTISQNDDACQASIGNRASSISFAATIGTTYRIQVDGYASNTGSFLLNWDLVASGPAASVTKTVDISSVATPQTLTYTITIDNIGSGQLSSPVVTDTLTLGAAARTLTSGPTYVSGDSNGNGQIGGNETWVYTATYDVTQADFDATGDFSNIATFTSTQTGAVNSLPVATTVTRTPSLDVTKTADDTTSVVAGQLITYTYVVTNDGNQTISNISLSDAHGGSGPAPVPGNEALTGDVSPAGDSSDGTTNNGVWDSLAPGDSVTFTATYTITQTDVDNQ